VPPEPGAKPTRYPEWLVMIAVGVPILGLLMGGLYSLPAMRLCKGRDPCLTGTLAAALAVTIFGLGLPMGISPVPLAGLWAASLLMLFAQRRLHGSLDGNLERFGLVHVFALMGTLALSIFLAERAA